MTTNVQNVPPGLPQPGQVPSTPSVQPTPVDVQPVAPVVPGTPSAATPTPGTQTPPHNPMLSHLSAPPAITPPAPAKPDPGAPAKPTPAKSDVEVFGDYADPAIAPAISYLEAVAADKKLDQERAFGKAVEHADARFIDEAYIKEVFGESAAQVIKTAKSVLEYAAAQQDAAVKSVYTLAGSEQNWQQASTVFNQHADADTKAALQGMLNSGDPAQLKYAAKQVIDFAVSRGALIQHHATPIGGNGAMKGLSAKEYIDAISKRNLTEAEYTTLKEQRKLGKQQGLN